MKSFAHINTENNTKQSLQEHLINVASLAGEFAASFNNKDWAYFAGMLHDLGKAFPEWQNHLLSNKGTSVNHSEAGAEYAYSILKDKYKPFEKVISYLIAGHHAGLPDWNGKSGTRLSSIIKKDDYKKLLNINDLQNILNQPLPKSIPLGNFNKAKENPQKLLVYYHLWIRMLYSCLVDADFLDTERFMTPDNTALRGNYLSISELKQRLDAYMENKSKNSSDSELNRIRKQILKDNIAAAQKESGFFSEEVPTGGGKTLAAMSFALHHAVKYNKQRVIVVIPYTSIIEQTAKVYKYGTDSDELIEQYKKEGKCLFGEGNVLEHHCNFDFDSNANKQLSQKQKLAVQNWDAPIVVTTNVQFFESIYNAHPSHERKLHNIVNSVIILDEVQMMSPEYLQSMLNALQGLVKCFGCTVVLSSATQPAIQGKIGSDTAQFDGIPKEDITPIINNPYELAQKLKRVNIDTSLCKNKIQSWEALACKLKEYNQVLCIVSTRKDCRELYNLMPQGTIHLSALMCPQDRSETISIIKQKLKNNETVRVISTQIVECGVDIDFPVVYRSIAGIDSIAQSAGRCNREGKIKQGGTLYLFNPPSCIPTGTMLKAFDTTSDLLEKYNYDIDLNPQLYNDYFTSYYKKINDFNKPDFTECMIDCKNKGNFEFRTLSDNYHLIENTYQQSVFVLYTSRFTGENNINLLQRLINGEINKELLNKLSLYSVNLPIKDVNTLVEQGRIICPVEGIYVQNISDTSLYERGLGVVMESKVTYATYVF